MSLSLADAERIARQGAEALRAGKAAEAKRHFEQLAATGRANVQIWLLLAHSCRLAGDMAGAERAADEALRQDKSNLRALIIKGDTRQHSGDDRAASSFYGAALRIADSIGSMPDELKAEVERARKAFDDNAASYRSRLEASLKDVAQSDRFRDSLALMFGEKQVFHQKPSAYYFPGLPQVQFYDPGQFEWAAAIEDSTADMVGELRSLLQSQGLFRPYLATTTDRPHYDFHGMHDNPSWSTLHLFENGRAVDEHVARCPKTFAAVQSAPLCRITTRAPSILFSLLKGGARIPPHHGMINTRLICHLPLVVPPGCGFRCGNEVREWEVGKLLIFDDTIEHEAWNDSAEDRVVLIFDVWRPELTEQERAAVGAMFEVIDAPQAR